MSNHSSCMCPLVVVASAHTVLDYNWVLLQEPIPKGYCKFEQQAVTKISGFTDIHYVYS